MVDAEKKEINSVVSAMGGTKGTKKKREKNEGTLVEEGKLTYPTVLWKG